MSRYGNLRLGVLTGFISRRAGGIASAVRPLAQELSSLGCEIGVFAGNDEYTAHDRVAWDPLTLSVQSLTGPRAFGFQRSLMRRLREFQPDLLHIHGLWMYPSMAARWWGKGGGPYCVSPHGMLDAWALQNSAWRKRVAGWLYENRHLRDAACIHALCESERNAIRAYGLKNPVCVIPSGMELPAEVTGRVPAWDSELPRGARVLLYLGRIHPKKGLVELLKGWAVAIKRKALGAEWFLVVAGWDQNGHQSELEALGRRLGIVERVRFVGPQFGEDKQAAYERAQAFVLPSLSEGLPMTVLEAWSHGLPVLMTPQCNLPIGFEKEAALKMEGDVSDIAGSLGQLGAMSEDDRQLMGHRGKELVARQFSWNVIARDMAAVYSWVLGKGPRPACVDMA